MLLNIDDVAAELRTTPGAARGVLERLRVKPINLGRGRGLGLRWYRHEIDEALDNSRLDKPKPAPIRKASRFQDKSVAQIIEELTKQDSK